MILFLLKNRRLRVQLFVGLLLVLGTIPKGSEGLKCFKCTDDDKTVCEKPIVKDCGKEPNAGCMNFTEEGGKAFGRDCVRKDILIKCLVEEGYASQGDSCGRVSDEDYGGPTYEAKMIPCFEKYISAESFRSLKGRRGRATGWNKQCVCDTDFCNIDKLPPGFKPSKNSQQQQTSSSKLIFTILTASFCNYLQG